MPTTEELTRHPEYTALQRAYLKDEIPAGKFLREIQELTKRLDKEKDKPQMATINEAAEKNKKTIQAEVIRAEGPITIPPPMGIPDAIRMLTAKLEEEEEMTSFSEDFDVFIEEGLYALSATLDKHYGWFQQIKTPGWFGGPPALIAVKTGHKTTVQVPWGAFRVPGIPPDDGMFETGYTEEKGKMIGFKLTATLKRKHSSQFHTLCAQIREQLATYSLYRGKAISISFFTEEGARIKHPKPDFPLIKPVDPKGMVFSQNIERAVEASLYTPITKTDRVRGFKIPLKRGILLAGPYGTGKTLIANRTKELATQNGWTFIMVPTSRDFAQCVKFAHAYQPCVVFCEDIDRVTDGNRDAAMDIILNTVDGVDSKNTEIMLVLTTNEIENINPAALRPGRFGDAVIFIQPPDAEAVTRLIRYYAGESLDKNANLQMVGNMLAGNTPAIISEVVERAKLSSVALDADLPEGKLCLTDDALCVSADTMEMQRALMNRPKVADKSDLEKVAGVIGYYIKDALENVYGNDEELVNRVQKLLPTKILSGV